MNSETSIKKLVKNPNPRPRNSKKKPVNLSKKFLKCVKQNNIT